MPIAINGTIVELLADGLEGGGVVKIAVDSIESFAPVLGHHVSGSLDTAEPAPLPPAGPVDTPQPEPVIPEPSPVEPSAPEQSPADSVAPETA